MDNPFDITLYNKAMTRIGFLNDPASIVVTPRHNAIGSAVITVPTSHRKVSLLRDTRAVIRYNGEHLMSGYITTGNLTIPRSSGMVSVTVQDDLWLLWRILGWAAPAAAINAQTTKSDTRTGAAETVAKTFVSAQLAHNTVDPIQVATSLGRGATITVSSRMKVLADVLMDAVDAAGIGLSARQVGTSIVLDAYTPAVYPHVLSEDSGTVLSGEFSWSAPTATRTIVGGPNVDTSREFRQRTDPTLEADLGYTIETFTDAQSATGSSQMDAAGDAALAAAGRKSGSNSGYLSPGRSGTAAGPVFTSAIGCPSGLRIRCSPMFSAKLNCRSHPRRACPSPRPWGNAPTTRTDEPTHSLPPCLAASEIYEPDRRSWLSQLSGSPAPSTPCRTRNGPNTRGPCTPRLVGNPTLRSPRTTPPTGPSTLPPGLRGRMG